MPELTVACTAFGRRLCPRNAWGGTLAFGSRSPQPRRRGCFACGRGAGPPPSDLSGRFRGDPWNESIPAPRAAARGPGFTPLDEGHEHAGFAPRPLPTPAIDVHHGHGDPVGGQEILSRD